ncbi:DNA-binding transcriptional regulator, MarR family [Granulicella rosea]|uniref:DNA-binding transcriptional regulator, MarR family n=1 Tax=Granulicella rosea TaxID=474952 RepID=A0A239LLR6_9BACT|nr:MarR family transcriptional regulator [Granulicella rosea]SNT30852.1 DNA-binding transcriptional regulator, MarR family [Granulicella rosea]
MSADVAGKPGKPTRRLSRAKTLRQAGKLIRRLILAAKNRLDDELRPQEVTAAQLRILYEVKLEPGATGAQLARACNVTPQTTQTMLAKAVERGWLERGKDTENNRLVTFTLTPAGLQMLEHGDTTYAEIEKAIWKGVATEEIEGFSALIEKALGNLAPHDRTRDKG